MSVSLSLLLQIQSNLVCYNRLSQIEFASACTGSVKPSCYLRLSHTELPLQAQSNRAVVIGLDKPSCYFSLSQIEMLLHMVAGLNQSRVTIFFFYFYCILVTRRSSIRMYCYLYMCCYFFNPCLNI